MLEVGSKFPDVHILKGVQTHIFYQQIY